eukprot:1159768-Prymnesium_polylepis.2
MPTPFRRPRSRCLRLPWARGSRRAAARSGCEVDPSRCSSLPPWRRSQRTPSRIRILPDP